VESSDLTARPEETYQMKKPEPSEHTVAARKRQATGLRVRGTRAKPWWRFW